MKPEFDNVSLGNKSSVRHDVPLHDFWHLPEAKTPLGKLFKALIEEDKWSSEMSIYGFFGSINAPTNRLTIFSKYFMEKDGRQEIKISDEEEVPDVAGVRKLVYDACLAQKNALYSSSATLMRAAETVDAEMKRLSAFHAAEMKKE